MGLVALELFSTWFLDRAGPDGFVQFLCEALFDCVIEIASAFLLRHSIVGGGQVGVATSHIYHATFPASFDLPAESNTIKLGFNGSVMGFYI